MSAALHITLLATADWDHPFWTNKQHVAVSLAELGHRVLYVDSLGLRPPTLAARDRGRLWRRLCRALPLPRAVRPGIWVISPLQLPMPAGPRVDRLNALVLRLSLGLARRRLGLRRDLLWTYNPRTAVLLSPGRYRRSLYHCVDAIDTQPGMEGERLRRDEQLLCRAVDLVVTTTPVLQERCARQARRCLLLPNVVEVEHFRRALDPALPIPEDLAAIPEPRLLFVGAIAAYKMDMELLAEVARRHPEWSIVLIGAVGEGDPATSTQALATLPNLHLLGPRPYGALPAYLRGGAVGLIPARINDYTRAMFPMKFFEYMAAGLPVVATPLPALEPYASVVALAPDAEAFAAAVARALRPDPAAAAERQRLAGEATYAQRSRRMLVALAEPANLTGAPQQRC
ncbi:MAG: glycosyltransferase [Prochlorococcaceae cyanobacterium]